MRIPGPKAVLRRLKRMLTPDPDRFLKQVTGVVHVGANVGQERGKYQQHHQRVLYIEPIPEVFRTLQANLHDFPEARALQYLVTDRDGQEYEFHVANNEGASSSIFDFAQHKDIWPEVHYERTIKLQGITLASLFQKEAIHAADYQALVMDTQGSELLVLKGAEPLLGGFQFIKLEVADFESYHGCCQLKDVDAFLRPRGFVPFSQHVFAERSGGGRYYEMVYVRK